MYMYAKIIDKPLSHYRQWIIDSVMLTFHMPPSNRLNFLHSFRYCCCHIHALSSSRCCSNNRFLPDYQALSVSTEFVWLYFTCIFSPTPNPCDQWMNSLYPNHLRVCTNGRTEQRCCLCLFPWDNCILLNAFTISIERLLRYAKLSSIKGKFPQMIKLSIWKDLVSMPQCRTTHKQGGTSNTAT